jgi:hypothetical protein
LVDIAARSLQPENATTSLVTTANNDFPGRWHRLRVPSGGDTVEEQQQLIDRLEAIGYVAGSKHAPSFSGVTRHDPGRAYAGLNLYTSGHAPGAVLCDMNGTVVHEWRRGYEAVWPGREIPAYGTGSEFWRRARVLSNGDIVAIFDGLGIVKLDKNSGLLWAEPNNAHHDLDIADSGDIFVLTREPTRVPAVDSARPLLEDYIVVLDASGNEKMRLSLLRCFLEIPRLARMVRNNARTTSDVLHTNSIELLRGERLPAIPGVKAGDILISSALLHTIAVVSMTDARIVWWFEGGFKLQHDPTVLANGNLLLFDNLGLGKHSRVLEYVPPSMRVTWAYRGSTREPFFTTTCGTNQRLPNGNTLITESDNGRAFEVTEDHDTVWEFYSPHRAGERDELIATLFALRRVTPEFRTDWLEQ